MKLAKWLAWRTIKSRFPLPWLTPRATDSETLRNWRHSSLKPGIRSSAKTKPTIYTSLSSAIKSPKLRPFSRSVSLSWLGSFSWLAASTSLTKSISTSRNTSLKLKNTRILMSRFVPKIRKLCLIQTRPRMQRTTPMKKPRKISPNSAKTHSSSFPSSMLWLLPYLPSSTTCVSPFTIAIKIQARNSLLTSFPSSRNPNATTQKFTTLKERKSRDANSRISMKSIATWKSCWNISWMSPSLWLLSRSMGFKSPRKTTANRKSTATLNSKRRSLAQNSEILLCNSRPAKRIRRLSNS